MAFDSKGTLNKVMLIGRLGQDPELKYTASGAAVLTLSIATNTSYKGQDGNAVEHTEWHRVVLWRKLAEIMAQYAKKGSRVYVEGKLATRSWDDKDGVKKYTTEITADQMQLLDSRGDKAVSEPVDVPPPTDQPAFDGPSNNEADDLPF
jgi:single-strand DNA-binding protein